MKIQNSKFTLLHIFLAIIFIILLILVSCLTMPNSQLMTLASEEDILHQTTLISSSQARALPKITIITPLQIHYDYFNSDNTLYPISNVQNMGSNNEFVKNTESLIERVKEDTGGILLRFNDSGIDSILDNGANGYSFSSLPTSNESNVPNPSYANKHWVAIFSTNVSVGHEYTYKAYFHAAVDKLIERYMLLNATSTIPIINMIGHSKGGIHNLEYAIEHPYNVENLISVGTPYNGSNIYNLVKNYNDDYTESIPELKQIGDAKVADANDELKNDWNNIASTCPIKFYTIATNISKNYLVNAIGSGIIDTIIQDIADSSPSYTFEKAKDKLLSIIDDGEIPKFLNYILSTETKTFINGLLNIIEDNLLQDNIAFSVDSQLANGYNNTINKTVTLNDFDADAWRSDNTLGATGHNTEIYNKEIIDYICGIVEVKPMDVKDLFITSNLDATTCKIIGIDKKYAEFYEVTDVIVPSVIDEYTVTQISNDAFASLDMLSIDLPDSLEYIENGAFGNNEELSIITVNADNMHYSSINGILFNKDGTELVSYPRAYYQNNALVSSYILPETTTIIGSQAFKNNTNLTTINLNNVEEISSYAFANCSNITTILGGTNLHYVYSGGFCDTPWFENATSSLVVGKTLIKHINAENTNVTFSEDIECIGPEAFKNTNITKIDLNNITIVGENAFEDCLALSELHLSSDNVSIAYNSLWGCDNLNSVYIYQYIPNEVLNFSFLFYITNNFTAYVPYASQAQYATKLSDYTELINSIEIDIAYYSDNQLIETRQAYYGQEETNVLVPEKTGYSFVGWYENTNFEGPVYQNGSFCNYTNDTSLYAKWEPLQFVISFTGIEIEDIPTKEVTYDAPIGSLPTATRLGYTLIGWKDENDEYCHEADIWDKTNNVVLTADWQPNTYNIVFEGNGGTPSINSQSVQFNDTVDTLATATKLGYTFIGWNTALNGNEQTLISTPFIYNFAQDITLYAQWELIEYTITYNLNGGTQNLDNPSSYTIISEDIILAPPSKLGNSFTSWNNADTQISSIPTGSYGNLVLTAIWSPNQYNITLDSNGGSCSVDTLIVTYGESFSLDALVTKEGHILDGWYDDNSVKYLTTNGESVRTWDKPSDATLIAEWSVEQYKIQINDNGNITWLGADGTLSNTPSDIPYGASIAAINLIAIFKADPAGFKEGQIFDHFEFNNAQLTWTSIPDLGEDGSVVSIIPVWVLEEHTIYFNTLTDTIVESIVTYYETDISLPVVNITGYTSGGWTQTIGSNTPVNWTKMPDLTPNSQNNGSITLYLIKEPINYTITYVLNGATNSSANPTSYNIESSITLQSCTKIGYIFNGWSTSSNYQNNISSIENMYGDLVLYADLSPIQYTMCYHSNGGTGNMLNSTHTYDEAKSLSENIFVLTGYHFIGWSTTETGEVIYLDEANILNATHINNTQINLYAKWAPNTYIITFNGNGNGDIYNQDVIFNSTVTTMPTMNWAGRTFKGWKLNANGSGDTIGAPFVYQYSTDITLYAQWEVINYTVSYVLNGGANNSSNPTSYNVESAITLLAPSKFGYRFAGWTTNNQSIETLSNGQIGNITLTANWYGYLKTYTAGGTYTISRSDFNNHSVVLLDCKNLNTSATTRFYISDDIEEVTFLGTAGRHMSNKQIVANSRSTPLTIKFSNFRISGPANENAVHLQNASGTKIIENNGTTYIAAGNRTEYKELSNYINYCVGIMGGPINFTGSGSLTVKGGDGIGEGEPGGFGIYGAITIEGISTMQIIGGNGANGAKGANGANGTNGIDGGSGQEPTAGSSGLKGKNGGTGGAGRSGIIGNLTIGNGCHVTIIGGNGGNGGDGGNGGNGGKGGNGRKGTVAVKVLEGANGGAGGQGGNGGTGGAGASATTLCTITNNGGTYTLQHGTGGAGGAGGKGGNGGAGGASTTNVWGNHVHGGNGGSGGQGGTGGAGGANGGNNGTGASGVSLGNGATGSNACSCT